MAAVSQQVSMHTKRALQKSLEYRKRDLLLTHISQATLALYFHQERQQELLRRKMVGLERLLRCDHLVSHVEAHVRYERARESESER